MNYQEFIHPSDQKALEALKALPGFDIVLKKVMSIVLEKVYKINMTSSYLKLGPNQLPEIYNILVKVCNKLNMEIPDLYLSSDREPNAYTSGDTDVFIVLHVGILETMTLEQIETVIAHECGHILCHHVLYHTMGRLLIMAADNLFNGILSKALITPLQYAFSYWMRCSEFSADRVSAYYHGSAEPVIDTMMSLAGGNRNLNYKLNKDVFLQQAEDYKTLIDNSIYDKAIEFMLFGQTSHPVLAYRAYEANEFYKRFNEKKGFFNTSNELDKKEFNFRIRYEYIKPKGIL